MDILSPEEMEIVVNKWINEDWAVRYIRLSRGHYEDVLPLIAKATQEAIYKWRKEDCPHRIMANPDGADIYLQRKGDCEECWEELKE